MKLLILSKYILDLSQQTSYYSYIIKVNFKYVIFIVAIIKMNFKVPFYFDTCLEEIDKSKSQTERWCS